MALGTDTSTTPCEHKPIWGFAQKRRNHAPSRTGLSGLTRPTRRKKKGDAWSPFRSLLDNGWHSVRALPLHGQNYPAGNDRARAPSPNYCPSPSLVVFTIAAATLDGSGLDAGRRSSKRPFQPSSSVAMGIRIDAPRSDMP